MSGLSYKIRPAVVVVLLLLIGEACVICLLSQRDWFVGGDQSRLAILILLAGLPILILFGCILRGALRFSIWQLLFAFAVLSVLFGRMAKPILEFRSARIGSMYLMQAGCNLTSPGDETRDNIKQSGIWTDLFLHEWEKLPVDEKVSCIVLHNDQQVRLLLNNAERFPALRSITLYQVSTDALQQLTQVLPKFELVDIWSQNVIFPAGFFRSLGNLQSLSVNWYPPAPVVAIQSADIADIAGMPHLIRFRAFGIAFQDEHAEILGRSKFIREVELSGTQVRASGVKALSAGLESRSVTVRDSLEPQSH